MLLFYDKDSILSLITSGFVEFDLLLSVLVIILW